MPSRPSSLRTCPFDTVTIVAGEPSVGAMAREHMLGDVILEYDDEVRQNRNYIEDAILVSLAGPYAQRRHDPSSKWRRGKDLKEASDLVYCLYRHCNRSARVTSSYWRHINDRIDDLLEEHW